MRKIEAGDLFQAVEVYQKLQSFADLNPGACDSAFKKYVLGGEWRGVVGRRGKIGEGD